MWPTGGAGTPPGVLSSVLTGRRWGVFVTVRFAYLTVTFAYHTVTFTECDCYVYVCDSHTLRVLSND